MSENPALGVLIFMLGGLAGAVFYLPFKKVVKWAWESYWLVYAITGLIIVPWVLALCTSPNVFSVLWNSPSKELAYCCLCGAMWGFGGLTWGLMIRYLGVGLGLAIGAGLVSAAGTLIPAALKEELHKLFENSAGMVSFCGVLVSLLGIVFVGMAGMSKENELPEEEKKKAVAEFSFRKGILVAIFSGLMSAGMGFGLQGGQTIEYKAQFGAETRIAKIGKDMEADPPPKELANAPGLFFDKDTSLWVAPGRVTGEQTTTRTWRGMPVLVVVLLGGFLVNFLWCLFLNFRNKTKGDYTRSDVSLIQNYFFAGLAGVLWCSQFICFKTGEPEMGKIAYVGWAVLMASMIMFGTLLGVLLGEWKGTSPRTRQLLAGGLVLLLGSSIIAGISGFLSQT